ncbi:MAG: Uncharacterized protein AUREO_027510 [Aureobasidium pullulans]|nr:MAG: Uncharacterized protein AUREO_027510 [Aureobasidium pullulans]
MAAQLRHQYCAHVPGSVHKLLNPISFATSCVHQTVMELAGIHLAIGPLLSGCYKIVTTVNQLHQSYKFLPMTLASIVATCNMTKITLGQLDSALAKDFDIVKEANKELVEQFDGIEIGCTITISLLEKHVTQLLHVASSEVPLKAQHTSRTGKWKALYNEPDMKELLGQLKDNNTLLNTILNVLQCDQQRVSMSKQDKMMNMMANQEKTLQNMLRARGSFRKYLEDAKVPLDSEVASILTASTSGTALTAFDFDSIIMRTSVYKRCLAKGSDNNELLISLQQLATDPAMVGPGARLAVGSGQLQSAPQSDARPDEGIGRVKTKRGETSVKAKEPKTSYVMLDSSYKVAYRIFPHGKGLKGDSHELRITPQGTAIIPIYHKRQTDCTSLGLGKSCWIQDGLFQEIDVETGALLFEWRATDHISMKDVFSTPNAKDGYGTSKKDAFDFFHINAVDKTDSGDYIISARYMHAILCVSGTTGQILWQLGGKKNNFTDLDEALEFSWQHHVTWQGNNTISLYDNHANTVLHSPSMYSKGMLIHLDMHNMTATLKHKYIHPDKILSVSQGSVQVIPSTKNILIGFGNSPAFVEYTHTGTVLCSAQFAPKFAFELVDFGLVKSYRVFKHDSWVGKPDTVPDVKVEGRKVYVSWNGATEVRGWRLERARTQDAGDDGFVTVQELRKDGFETSFSVEGVGKFIRIAALDSENGVMARSAVIHVKPRHMSLFWSLSIAMLAILGLCFIYRILPKSLLSNMTQLLSTLKSVFTDFLMRLRPSKPRPKTWMSDEDDQNLEAEPLLYMD